MSSKLVFPHFRGLEHADVVLGVTEEFDDLTGAEEAEVSRVRQPATRRTDGRGLSGEER